MGSWVTPVVPMYRKLILPSRVTGVVVCGISTTESQLMFSVVKMTRHRRPLVLQGTDH